MDLIIQCDHCKGTGKIKKESLDNNLRTVENIICDDCNGIGYVIKKGHYLSYDLIKVKREIDNLWDIIKHYVPLPYYYTYGIEKTCDSCRGYGFIEHQVENSDKQVFKRIKCDKCKGTGRIQTKTIKDIYNEIFQKYLELKQDKKEIVNALKNKTWENTIYNSFEELHPHGFWEVCIRCNTYFDSAENINACCACTNESMIPENGCYFDPIDDKAREWFVNKGFKKCIGYSPYYKFWRNKYIKPIN